MTHKTRACRHRNLVSSRLCRIEQCEHATVHLVLGDLTLRLRPDDLLDISGALEVASRHLASRHLDGGDAARRLC